MNRSAILIASITAILLSVPARGDEIATLPLGQPSRAYILGSGEAGQIIRCLDIKTEVLDLNRFGENLAGVDVLIVGENHTNLDGHRTQWKILETLAASGRPFALGMEFFDLDDDAALAEYSSGKADLAKMLEQTGWYASGAYNFEYYRPLVETCRAHQAPIYGLNVPREWVRVVSRQGADALSEDQRRAVGEVGPVDDRHKFIVNQMMGGIGAAMPTMFEGMYRGQTAWDSAMATSILRAHAKHKAEGKPRIIVVIVGSGHMAHGLAIPARLRAADPSLVVRTVGPVQGDLPSDDQQLHPGFERKETAVFSLGYADYVYVLPDVGGAEEYPLTGVRLDRPKDAASADAPLQVASVASGGIGDRAGLRKGDTVLSIGSERPGTVPQAGAILGTLRWNERVEWRVQRNGAELTIPMLVVPPSDNEGDWLKSTAASGLLDTFDPGSDRSYLEPKGLKPAATYARLVKFRERAVRVDVLNAGVLWETWNLDDAGRPVLGLLAMPAADGAVRIEITRDAAGKATETRRIDSAGKPIAAAKAATDPHADVTK